MHSANDTPRHQARAAWPDPVASLDRANDTKSASESKYRLPPHATATESEPDFAPAPTPAVMRPADLPSKPVPIAALDDTLLTVSDDDGASLDIVVSSERVRSYPGANHQQEREGLPKVDGLVAPSICSHYGATFIKLLAVIS